eukprot:4391763-Pleurochrysis_carterae.AAC.1
MGACVGTWVRAWVRGCVATWVRAWVRGCVGAWVCGYAAACVGAWVRGCVRGYVRACVRVLLRGYVSACVRVCVGAWRARLFVSGRTRPRARECDSERRHVSARALAWVRACGCQRLLVRAYMQACRCHLSVRTRKQSASAQWLCALTLLRSEGRVEQQLCESGDLRRAVPPV